MSPELGGKWETECLNTRFPLFTLLFAAALCERYSVKLIYSFLAVLIGHTKRAGSKILWKVLLPILLRVKQREAKKKSIFFYKDFKSNGIYLFIYLFRFTSGKLH